MTPNHIYSVRARGFDAINNPEPVIVFSTFTFDVTKPTSCVVNARKPSPDNLVPVAIAGQYFEDIHS